MTRKRSTSFFPSTVNVVSLRLMCVTLYDCNLDPMVLLTIQSEEDNIFYVECLATHNIHVLLVIIL